MTKPLPPNRPPGTIDLLDSGDPDAPRDAVPDASWRADALGRSRHSRLAEELRPQLDDPDPARAELVCARIAREALGDYAPAVLLLSADKRRRLQSLTAWTATLFDLALRPGLAGLDGDRLAQINAWEFQTEEALGGNAPEQPPGQPPTQPVFVAMARADEEEPWPREALDRLVAGARNAAVARPDRGGSGGTAGDGTHASFLEALFGTGHEEAAKVLAQLVPLAPLAPLASLAQVPPAPEPAAKRSARKAGDARPAGAPPGWRRALGYARRVTEFKRRNGEGVDRPLGLGTRLRLLASAAIFR